MHTDTVIIGAGHAGLAMSRHLTRRVIDHVVLERGEVANSWRTERWDSLRLLTPNWMSRLPDYQYRGDNPDGYMTMPETVAYIRRYAELIMAPVQTRTAVTALRRTRYGYQVVTNRGAWQCRSVVVASGACNVPTVPALADDLPAGIDQVTPHGYRNPDQLADGGVLVVGASASGIQIAREIHRSGRPVTLAVGEHIRAPRTYRGRDILWWMEMLGLFGERHDQVEDLIRARRLPSLQLVGSPDRGTLDLNALGELGVRRVGRLVGLRGGKAQFSGSLANHCTLSDLKMNRLLERIDAWIDERGLGDEVEPPSRFEATAVDPTPTLELDLAGIRTVVWATGYRPDHGWIEIPVFDRKGRIRHQGGVVTDSPGLYMMGLPFMRQRKSAMLDGAADDARDLAAHLASHLDMRAMPAWDLSLAAAS